MTPISLFGKNLVDRSETEMIAKAGLDKKGVQREGTTTAAQQVKHELMEAYESAKTGKHVFTPTGDRSPHDNNPYPGFGNPSGSVKTSSATWSNRLMKNSRGTYTFKKVFDGGVATVPVVGDVRTGNITRVSYKPDK